MDFLPQPNLKSKLRVFVNWRGHLATCTGGSNRPATAIDLLKAPRPTRRAIGYREDV